MALAVKNPPPMQADINNADLIPGSGRSPRDGIGNPFQYSCLENSMDRGVLRATVHGVTKCWTRLKQLRMQGSQETTTPIAQMITGNDSQLESIQTMAMCLPEKGFREELFLLVTN